MPRSAEKSQLSLGVFARSRKPNERRLPIHTVHLDRIDHRIRHRIFLEHGYDGAEFGANVQAEDLAEFKVGQVVWGWPHCVQDTGLTQIAID